MVAGLHHAHHRGGDGAQAAGQGDGRLGVLQVGDLLLQLVVVGVAKAGVDKALVHMLVQVDGGVKVLQHIGGGLVDGAHMGHGLGLVAAGQAGMQLLGMQNVGIEFHSVGSSCSVRWVSHRFFSIIKRTRRHGNRQFAGKSLNFIRQFVGFLAAHPARPGRICWG